MSSKYKFVEIEFWPGDRGVVTWFTDEEIEAELRLECGTPVTLEQAAKVFFKDSVTDGMCNVEVYELGILGYAHSLGFRVDLLSAFDFMEVA